MQSTDSIQPHWILYATTERTLSSLIYLPKHWALPSSILIFSVLIIIILVWLLIKNCKLLRAFKWTRSELTWQSNILAWFKLIFVIHEFRVKHIDLQLISIIIVWIIKSVAWLLIQCITICLIVWVVLRWWNIAAHIIWKTHCFWILFVSITVRRWLKFLTESRIVWA